MAEHAKAPGRRLREVAIRPGISLYLPPYSYANTTLSEKVYPHLRIWDVGPHCLIQHVNDAGEVKDQVEVLWHSIWWRKEYHK